MPKNPNKANIFNTIFKREQNISKVLLDIHRLYSPNCPYPVTKSTFRGITKKFREALFEYEDNLLTPNDWVDLIDDFGRSEELKERMILESYLGWIEFEEMVNDHADFLESVYTDEVSWNIGDGNLIPYEAYRLYVLSDLCSHRLSIDVERWKLLKSHKLVFDDYDWVRFGNYGDCPVKLGILDYKLWQKFEEIIRFTIPPGGATPPLHEYERSGHFAQTISIETCKRAFTSNFADTPSNLILTSSFMSALHSLILSLSDLKIDKKPFQIGVMGSGIYFEVKELLGIAKHIFGEQVSISKVESINNTENLDAIYFEVMSNTPNGNAPLWEDVLKVAKVTSCKYIITDVTLNPFALNSNHIKDFSGTLVFLQSLAKYAQLGSNVAMGGLAIVFEDIDKNSPTSIVNRMQFYTKILGQHPNSNIAKSLCRNPTVIENRLKKSRRNAAILGVILSKFCDKKSSWYPILSELNESPTVWILVKETWVERAKKIYPKKFPYGIKNEKIDCKSKKDYIKNVLEAYLWDYPIDSWEDIPVVRSSFGFNQTSFLMLDATGNDVYIRISCGQESLEMLRAIAINTLSILNE